MINVQQKNLSGGDKCPHIVAVFLFLRDPACLARAAAVWCWHLWPALR